MREVMKIALSPLYPASVRLKAMRIILQFAAPPVARRIMTSGDPLGFLGGLAKAAEETIVDQKLSPGSRLNKKLAKMAARGQRP